MVGSAGLRHACVTSLLAGARRDQTEIGELTDSFRGVTSDTITVGLTTFDFEGLNKTFGLGLMELTRFR